MKPIAAIRVRLLLLHRSLLLSLLLAAVPLSAQTLDSRGEVMKIDHTTGRVTLRHGGVRSLDMPSMTMVFRVADPKLLEGVAAGDQVRFAADKVGGQYTIVALVKAP